MLSSALGQANNDERPNQVPPSDQTDEARQNNILVGGAVVGMTDPSLLSKSHKISSVLNLLWLAKSINGMQQLLEQEK